jgi:hypothetical protein
LIEQQYQATIRRGWSIYLEKQTHQGGPTYLGSFIGKGKGNLAIDKAGKIWVTGLGEGLQFLEGEEWNSRTGDYTNLAIDPRGKVWAVRYFGSVHSGVDVFDGKSWTSYETRDFGIEDKTIVQVEISSDGRVFIATGEFGPERIFEIVNQDEDSYTAVSRQGLSIGDGHIESLDADNQGGIWAAIWQYNDAHTHSGLYKLNGNTWQPVPDQGMDLRHVVQTTFDNQGHAWILKLSGAVLTYDGQDWTTVVAEDVSPVSSGYGRGLLVDNHDRLWLWQRDSVHLLEEGTWISLTENNSGLSRGIYGVIVDDLDRLWIASTGGVSMIPVNDIESIRDETVNLYKRMNGTNWFLPSVLILLWLAIYLNSLPGVLIAAVVGMLLTYLFGAPYMEQPGYSYYVINPGVFVTMGGMAGGLLGGKIDKNKNIVWAFLGLVIGVGCYLPYGMITSP